jgi:hypothetical protein
MTGRQWLALIIVILVLLTGGYFLLAWLYNYWPFEDGTLAPTAPAAKKPNKRHFAPTAPQT